ncbi:hypothetical protein ACJJI4_09550 [Microbulbifer sp. TRSA002]|uniref:hypothetical protein n=1 Tax=Microbulbifer sp. TRSA002 TaxID=3243382 RepID=UPI004039349A
MSISYQIHSIKKFCEDAPSKLRSFSDKRSLDDFLGEVQEAISELQSIGQYLFRDKDDSDIFLERLEDCEKLMESLEQLEVATEKKIEHVDINNSFAKSKGEEGRRHGQAVSGLDRFSSPDNSGWYELDINTGQIVARLSD